MSERNRLSLRFPMRWEELESDPVDLVLGAAIAVGSLGRVLWLGAVVASPLVVMCMRTQLPIRYGGALFGTAAREARQRIETWGKSIGGSGWKKDLARRVESVAQHSDMTDDLDDDDLAL